MDASQLEHFRHILEELLEGLEDPFGRRDEIAVENTPDALDQVQNAADRALAIRQLELDSSRLRGLKDALGRIEDGSYGTCLRCDEDISLKRLKALPWAAYCIACQDAADREESEAAGHDEHVASLIGAR
jgi:DnaK suppressor protein